MITICPVPLIEKVILCVFALSSESNLVTSSGFVYTYTICEQNVNGQSKYTLSDLFVILTKRMIGYSCVPEYIKMLDVS